MKNKFLILFLFCLSMGLARAQREPMGLLDDMLLTASQQHLPATVIHFDADDADLSDHAWRELSAAADLMAAAGDDAVFYLVGSADNARESDRVRRKLATKRCRKVFEALVSLGVKKESLKFLLDGGFMEVAPQQGRGMVLVIMRTRDTEDVVARWIPQY